jgi:hypothetical protein
MGDGQTTREQTTRDWDTGERRRVGAHGAPARQACDEERERTDERPHCFRAKQINIRGSRNLFFFLFLTERAAPIEPRPDRSYRRKCMLDHYVFRLTVQCRIIFTQPRTEGVPASNSNSTGEVCTANTSHFAKEKCYHEATKQSVNIPTRETVTTRTLE